MFLAILLIVLLRYAVWCLCGILWLVVAVLNCSLCTRHSVIRGHLRCRLLTRVHAIYSDLVKAAVAEWGRGCLGIRRSWVHPPDTPSLCVEVSLAPWVRHLTPKSPPAMSSTWSAEQPSAGWMVKLNMYKGLLWEIASAKWLINTRQ